ncbi:hypothetical protein EYY58_08015, partial [Acinetobacter bereziniae]
MQITGYDYVIISNVSPNIAVIEFNHRIKSMWNNVQLIIMEEFNHRIKSMWNNVQLIIMEELND